MNELRMAAPAVHAFSLGLHMTAPTANFDLRNLRLDLNRFLHTPKWLGLGGTRISPIRWHFDDQQVVRPNPMNLTGNKLLLVLAIIHGDV